MPPREALGWFTRPGDCDAIATWLSEVEAERFVISLDMVGFGGLVASRAPGTSLKQALGRLEVLRRLRESRPDATIFAFSTIMRLGQTVARSSALEEHLLLRSYSELLDRAERLGEQDARADLAQAERKLDSAVLSNYLRARQRNHAVNRAAVGLAADGVLDYLVLSQEDAAPVGIHIPEQLALRALIEEFRVGDRVTIAQGADEVGLLLMARHCVVAAGDSIGIALDYAAEPGADVYPAFESQPLRQTAEASVAAAGARSCPPMEADALLFVHTPVESQPDISEAPPEGQSPALSLQADGLAERVEAAVAAGRVVGVADVAYCNGADPELISALQRRNLLEKLHAFAAWNTAANTLGTVVSHLCVKAAADPAGDHASVRGPRWSVATRLLDDYGYQSVVRQRAAERARERGADPFALGSACEGLEEFVSSEMQDIARELLADFPEALSAGQGPRLRVSLPWHRLFEIEFEFPDSLART
jgi:hypothetical protein